MIDLEWFLHLMTCLQSPAREDGSRRDHEHRGTEEPLAA